MKKYSTGVVSSTQKVETQNAKVLYFFYLCSIMVQDNTLEQQVADTILAEPLQIKVGGKTIKVPRPTLSTIIEVSKMISTFPYVEFDINSEKIIHETLRIAQQYDGFEEVLAMLIIGKKRAKATISIFGKEIVLFDRVKRYAKRLKDTLTPREMAQAVVTIFSSMDCGFFLATITSLNNINHLKQTNQTTPFGQ